MDATYKELPEHPNYRAGSDGSVWSRRNNRWGVTDTWRQLKPGVNRASPNHPRLIVVIDGKTRYVHQLVLEAFIGMRPEGYECCHRDNNPLNNCLENLYWGTKAQNAQDMSLNGRKKGERHHKAKLNDELVRQIRVRVAHDESQASVARSLGVNPHTVSNVITRKAWAHVPD